MEVTTMSSRPDSHNEGDDLCETDVTSVATHSVTLLICLCGVAGNGAVIGLLSLKTYNSGIFKLAVADFLFLLLTVLSALLFLVEDVSCSPVMPMLYLRFLFQLSLVSYYWGLFWLRPAGTVLYMHKIFQRCRWDLTERMWLLVGSVQSWAFFALFTVIPSVIFLCHSQEQECCRVPLISMYTIILLLLAAPVVISGTIDFINAKRGSQEQQPKRRDMVIHLATLLTLLLSLCHFLQQLGYIDVPSQAVFLLPCTNSSIKPFIYFLAGSSWKAFFTFRYWRHSTVGSLRLSLQRIFE
ncbi:mas-related G-protein coupled receptor member H-like [Haemorhous mexicanus]|uniref:mas-related G-protein coupled receptor member H-like n=1 Tax=Haemorhous mexicanus TaxID=30427 RepID=UPI0028BE8D52|nr:mas-related G-protein coupled receptor member H-like [Haemorhous mexicanus]